MKNENDVFICVPQSWSTCFCSPVVEYMPARYRTSVASSLHLLFALGEVFVGVVAVFVRQWRILQLIISVPVILLLAVYWWGECVLWCTYTEHLMQKRVIVPLP